ncbi:MAG: SUMF1/EgtB/PvdO family nonheme iron enzyme [Phaeodactylibacter sp.]|nr:SUMF1/EgtB/PvdO family nonheme iron enzyme [Phaeodactylibacter sp.]
MRKTIPFLLLLVCLPSLAMVPKQAGTVSPTPRPGKDYALFFAVEQYQEWPMLHNPIDDAEEIAKDLRELYGFNTEVVPNPTRNQIYDKLDAYQKKAYAEDAQLLIFFSGHGDFIETKGEGFFIPKDGKLNDRYQDTYLPHARLQRIIDNIPCSHILLAIDACFSGTFDEQVAAQYKNKPNWKRYNENEDTERRQFIDNTLRYRTRLFLTSGGKERTPDPSEFADSFKRALRAFGGQDRILEFHELYYQYLQKASPQPRFGQFGSNQTGSNFLFILADGKKAAPAPAVDSETTVWQAARQQHTAEAYRAYLQLYPGGKYRLEAERYIRDLSPPDNMVFIQGGPFEMGDTFGDGGSDEKPVHTVTVSDFEIGRHEVTVEEFSRFANASGYKTDAEKGDGSYIYENGSWNKKAGINWRHDATGKLRPSGEYNHPVIHVSWNDAVAYCNWLSEQHGYQKVYTISGGTVTANWSANGYRLPTEAEWEFAARSGGKKYKYAWGNDNTPHANIADESFKKQYSGWTIWEGYNDGYVHTSPVGKFEQGDLGLADMTGNVWEWCWDWYDSDYYEKSKNSRDPRGPDSGSFRVLRGGSWVSLPALVRCADRSDSAPGGRSYSVGFRLARAVR